MTRRTVVIEYTFRGYTQPDDVEAMVIECSVTHSDALLGGLRGDLAQVRAALDDAGYERQPETAPIERYQAGRWCPTWREVWGRGACCSPVYGLSPEAQKAQREAAGRMRGWWPHAGRKLRQHKGDCTKAKVGRTQTPKGFCTVGGGELA